MIFYKYQLKIYLNQLPVLLVYYVTSVSHPPGAMHLMGIIQLQNFLFKINLKFSTYVSLTYMTKGFKKIENF